MANDFYNYSVTLSAQTLAKAADVNTRFAAVEDGFDLLPSEENLNYDKLTYAVDSGAANALVVAMPKTWTSYITGARLGVLVNATNTGDATINVNGLGAKNIKRIDGTNPEAGDLTASDIAYMVYDGTNFVMAGPYRSHMAGMASNLAADLAFTGNPSFTNIDVNGGAVDGTPVGATSASTGAFTTFSASGVASFASGTEAAPGISFTDDPDSGLYRIGANNIGMSLGGDLGASFAAGSLRINGDDTSAILSLDILEQGLNSRDPQIRGIITGGAGQNGLAFYIANADVPAEFGRMHHNGYFLIGKTTGNDPGTVGVEAWKTGFLGATRSSATVMIIGRNTTDGTLVSLRGDNTEEGTISLSGTTVSYNNFVGAHYSEKDGEPAELLPGTIVESTGELVTERFTASERLVKFKIADKGSRVVYGTILGPSIEDDIEDEDGNKIPQGEGRNPVRTQYLVAGLGAYQVRMKKGQKPVNGDLVESAGGGVGAVQKDDIVTSRTVAKITGSHPVAAYEDGSTVWPAVIMCG